MRANLVPGVNVDAINIEAGLKELVVCGYSNQQTKLVIEYALARWAKGEEEAAERGAIDTGFYGISLTCWRRVLAAACAEGQLK